MGRDAANVEPKNFFLNEQHELARGEKRGGRLPQFVGIDWRAKGQRINTSLLHVRDRIKSSRDPLRESRYFVLARPPAQVAKKSEDKKKAQGGQIVLDVVYSGRESRIFGRLGLDLIQVNPDGTATVHALPDRFEQLVHSSAILEEFGARERARWAKLESFELVPSKFILDHAWLNQLKAKALVEVIIELQPLLTGVEADRVTRAVAEALHKDAGELLQGVGTDFSGRMWLRGKLLKDSLVHFAKTFFSIQAMHRPLLAVFHAPPPSIKSTRTATTRTAFPVPDDLPCVAVVDTGVPADHRLLRAYRRGQYVAPPPCVGACSGDHGSMVASRIVFGDVDGSEGPPSNAVGACSFYDVNIALDDQHTYEKSVLPALEAIVGVAPDVRVFNLSFDNVRPLDAEPQIERLEKLRLLQDLDNFVFARDVLVVVAAGNSPKGVPPNTPYPLHFTDPRWALGTWPRSFNALTCGSFVSELELHADGVAQEPGAPSPFTKVGWGLCASPKPDLSDHGGNGNADFRWQRGMGVWGCTAAGVWEDWSGTSFAAPLLARQGAIVLQELNKLCEPGTRPFAATAKAYLALSASQRELSSQLKPLAERTLGKGKASSAWLETAKADRAMVLWQGVLDGPSDLARVLFPIPKAWLNEAKSPRLRLVVAWDAPVNAAVEDLWASRKVNVQLRVQPDTRAVSSSRTGHKSYPLIERTYDLNRLPEGVKPNDDSWLLEFSYEEAAEYYPGFDFTPRQRLAFAAELYDADESPVSPQPTLQALPIVSSMTRFSIATTAIRNPIVLKNRV